MRLVLLTALTMAAFAANSVLTRLALVETALSPGDFAFVRLASGAAMLLALARLRGAGTRTPVPLRARLPGAATLALYMLGFSFAYRSLDACVGALLLFGGVQITMFAGALVARERVPPLHWIGAAVAFSGLVWLLWPRGTAAPDPLGAGLMIAAALGWGLYSLIGRRATTGPLETTGWSFLLAVPAGALAAWATAGPWDSAGVGLAVASGALTSGLGYALWYRVLPGLGASLAAVAQLTVPVIAMAGGMIVLGEPLTAHFAGSAALVLGGIGLSLVRRPVRAGAMR
ncbi:MAG: DMT family transporter [Maritimibacter sp.]|nr:DMT family transporter [Maritimibacter sp.]